MGGHIGQVWDNATSGGGGGIGGLLKGPANALGINLGGINLGGTPAVPVVPDYVGAARETSKGNLELEKYRTLANRVNQNSIGGSTSYVQNPDGTWTQNQKLSQPNQNTYETAAGQLNRNATLNADKLATSAGNPDLLNNQVTNALYAQQAQYLDPQFRQQHVDLENQLANQGITRGSEAWNREMQNAALQKQQAYGNAAASAIGGGTQAAQGMFGMNLQNAQLQNQAGAQNLNQQIAMQNQYGNLMNVAQGGVPTSPIAQQGAVAGPDLLGAAQGQGNYNMGLYNAQMAARTSQTNGMFSMASAAAAAAASDPVTKENVVKIGEKNGFNIYEFDYKAPFKAMAGFGRYIGVMADEVKRVKPEAVVTGIDGIMRVNYSMLGLSMMEV